MPYHPLREAFIVVYVDEVPADPDTGNADLEGRRDNLHPVGVGIAPDIHGLAPGVGGVTRPALRLFVGFRPIRTIQHQRDARSLPDAVQNLKEFPVHILDTAGRDAPLEFGRGEILTHCRPPSRQDTAACLP